jgi:hypothetical protein
MSSKELANLLGVTDNAINYLAPLEGISRIPLLATIPVWASLSGHPCREICAAAGIPLPSPPAYPVEQRRACGLST